MTSETENRRLDMQTLFAGGRLCLDFINTLCQRRGVEWEFIGNGEELRTWLRQAESIYERPLCPDDTIWTADYMESILPRAIELRTALHDLVESIIEKKPASATAIETVNAILRANPTYIQLENDNRGFQEVITASRPEERWLTAIARDAVDLLSHADLSLLRRCECVSCVRVFYDMTKNHKRKWCVEKCSSQTKAAAYYQRKKARVAKEAAETA